MTTNALNANNASWNGMYHGSLQAGMCARIVQEKTGGNEMTLKEKVAEVQPSRINSLVVGGVIGCPRNYAYLHGSISELEILGEACGVDCCLKTSRDLKCRTCWNRKYIEPEEKQCL